MSILKQMVPGPIKRLARTWMERLALERSLRRATPVLVYQMSKVGSLSVHVSLTEQYPGAVVHAHGFSPSYPDARVRRLYRWTLSQNRPLNVISLTREPVGRNVSSFFQRFELETGVPFAHSTFTLDELQSIFLAKFRHDHALTWFDRHILANFGIDVYASPFPREGYSVHAHGNVRLLVLRSEISDAAKAEAIARFLDLPGFELRSTNFGDEKDYGATYRAFKQQVKLPVEYVERLCGSRYFQHFYDDAMRASVLARWCE